MKYFRNLLKISSLVLVLVLQPLPLKAQKDQTLRLASRLERSHSYEEALRLYLQLYQKGKYSFQIVRGIEHCYEKLNRFPELLAFFEKLSKKYPANLNHKLSLGRAYFLNRQKEKAQKIWQEILAREPALAANYRLVGLTLVDLNLYKEAIDVYKQALQKFKKQERLYNDIARLYQAQLDYKNALENYLLYYRHFKKQKLYVQSRLVAMMKDKESVPQLLKGLAAYKERAGSDHFITETEASLYIRLRNFDKAYRLYLDLHKQNPLQNFLQRFARSAFANQSYVYALKAYRVLLNERRGLRRQAPYLLEIAKIYYTTGKEKTRAGNEQQGQEDVQKALTQLKKLTAAQINPSIRIKSLELWGDIEHDYFNDVDQALSAYRQSLNIKRRGPEADRIKLKLAQTYLEKNELHSAVTYYRDVDSRGEKQLAALNLAQVDFYKGQFTKAQKALDLLLHRTTAEDTTVNNAIKLLLLCEQFKNDSLSLAQFAKGELLLRQKKISRAAKVFYTLFEAGKSLSPLAGIKAARLLRRLDKDADAEKLLLRFLQQYPRQDMADEAVFTLASIYEQRKQFAQALTFYKRLLTDFPLSFYRAPARTRARILTEKIKERSAS